MGYRKVSYAEQVWYIIRYKLRELLRREDKLMRETVQSLERLDSDDLRLIQMTVERLLKK